MIGSGHLRRAQILLSQERYKDAEKELGQALGQDPNDPFALAMLSDVYLETDRRPKALELAQEAMAKEPNFPFFYHQLARAYFFNNKIKECKETINAGIGLSPNDPDFYLLLSQIEYFQENWEASLAAADKGLALDPERVGLINQRTQALVKLNRKAEAAATVDFALHNEPENAYAHANKGWVAIEQDDYETAVKHFKESLRLDPTNAYTRTGLKEAIKAKNILYRYVLKYFLWMNKMQEKSRWGFVIGIYVLYQIILKISSSFPTLATILSPIIVLYILMAFSSWIAMPVSNAFLRFHPLGKHALTKDEIRASTAVMSLLAGAVVSIAAFFILGHAIELRNGSIFISTGGEFLFTLSIVLLLLMIPVGAFFKTTAETKHRKQMGIILGVIITLGLLAVFTSLEWPLGLFFLGILGTSIAANVIMGREAREV